MRILVVHNDYQQAGGERSAARAQINILRQHGHEVTVFWRDNAAIEQFALRDKAAFFPRTIYNSAIYREITQLVRRERIDVAHIHNVFPLISPAIYRALHNAGVPMVQTIHNFRLMCPNALFYTRGAVCERCKLGNMLPAIRLRCYRESLPLSALYAGAIMLHRRMGTFALIDRALALTNFVAKKLIESGVIAADRVAVLGNALSANGIARQAGSPFDPTVVFLGRLVPEKGLDLAIRAMAQLPDLELQICGEGPDLSRLRDLTDKLGLANVQFLGFVAGEQKRQVLERALAVVVPSRWYELFPMSILEAMSAGVPVVAANRGSLPSLIEDGRTGLLFTPDDPHSLAARLRDLADSPELNRSIAAQASAYVREHHSSEVYYRALIGHYAELTKALQ